MDDDDRERRRYESLLRMANDQNGNANERQIAQKKADALDAQYGFSTRKQLANSESMPRDVISKVNDILKDLFN